MKASAIGLSWIESTGGPLIVVPRMTLARWGGAFAADGAPSDYQRACAVSDELGVIRHEGADVLVLGDEPHRTTYLEDGDLKCLVRWVAAVSEESLLEMVRQKVGEPHGEPRVCFSTSDEQLFLIDSSDRGAELHSPSLSIYLAAGKYVVDTLRLRSVDVQVLIHRIVHTAGRVGALV